jgi:hypothetical protein
MAQFFEEGNNGGPEIPYRKLSELLFTDDELGFQLLVPFLGAGASVGLRPPANESVELNPVPAEEVKRFSSALGLSGTAARLIELLAQLALSIEAREQAAIGARKVSDAFKTACEAKYPPSATDLAAALAVQANYDGFERPRRRIGPLLAMGKEEREKLNQLLTWIADLTEIGSSVPPLLSVASFYQYQLPGSLRDDLKRIFKSKTTPTLTHCLVAYAALAHLKGNYKHYLIVTTNYDCLMEKALDLIDRPYCVLTVVSPTQPVGVRFSPNMQQYLGLKASYYDDLRKGAPPGQFWLDLPKPVVILFKLHGCLSPDSPSDDVVLSDEDYIRYLMQMHDGAMIPALLSQYLNSAGFLFLGYSFSDWNVRAIYKSVITRRFNQPNLTERGTREAETKDWAVVHEFSHYESVLYRTSIHMIVTALAKFARKITDDAVTDGRVDREAAQQLLQEVER